ncbi:SiaB family protein kinase [Rhodoflexus caldus]|uniref:SiaB family protein kinase n=1 Tax=Rhodoflexus caldus TaxID=2891236 RepID=UPI00202A4809|nr:SiaB family protein kinase [Rhodoflexus caldus]
MSQQNNNDTTYDFYKLVEEHHILLAFQGMMTTDVLTMMGRNVKEQAESDITRRRIFSVMVELVQNINLYSAEKDYSESDKKMVGKGIVVIATNDDESAFTVGSGNTVKNEQIDYLKQKLDYINQLDDEQLRGYFRQQLRTPEDQDSTGLVGVIRKAKNPLRYEFLPTDNEHSFFILTVQINQEKK